jgi:hypothetical protein
MTSDGNPFEVWDIIHWISQSLWRSIWRFRHIFLNNSGLINISGISICSRCSHLEYRASVKRYVSLQFLNLRHSVWLPGWVISPSQGRYLHRTTQTQNKSRRTSMPWVGFEPSIPAFKRAKTVHALDRAATVIGISGICLFINNHFERHFFICYVTVLRT